MKELKEEKNIIEIEDNDPIGDYIRKNCSIRNDGTEEEKSLYYQIVGYFEEELYLPKEKDFLDKCFVHVNEDESSDKISFSIFRFWKADCYLQIKNILKHKDITWVLDNIIFCVDNYCRKIGYDGLKCYLSYNGKKLEVKLVFNYLGKEKDKHEIELFVFVERPYSDVMRIVPLSI